MLLGICRAARKQMHGTGAGITMMGRDGWRGVIAATGPLSERLEELQFVCGEGPCIDAVRLGHPVLVDDLEDRLWRDWTGYAPAAQAAGVRAVFAFPIQVGAARIAVLDVYRDVAGPLTGDELADGLVFADFALDALLDGQQSAPAGHSPAGMEDAFDYRIYQAQGMVSVQLQIDLLEAMARLRAHAWGSQLRLGDVADDVLAGSLHLDKDR
ncbi:MAG TPA: GAF and ANTAR domain-containing protein [Microlunatus sp.]